MTYTQVQRRRIADALARSQALTLEALGAVDVETRDELQSAAADWVRHADRIANKLHARRKLQGVK